MISVLLLMLIQPPQVGAPKVSHLDLKSIIDWNGGETWEEVLRTLNQTGNVVIDMRAARGQTASMPALQIKAGRQTFWKALDEVCAQAKLQWTLRNGQIELINSEGARATWIAYDGAWRGRIVRRSLIGYDDPVLDRLLCQVELMPEPRLQALLLDYQPGLKEYPGKDMTMLGSRGSISFDGEASKVFEIRLPMPPRKLWVVDKIRVTGTAWVAPGRLTFTSPLTNAPKQTQQGVTLSITSLDINQASKTWEVTTELQYPSGGLEFESHQARLLSSMKLVLSNGKEQVADIGRDIRTDNGPKVTAKWLFRNVPGASSAWKAVLTVPAPPRKEMVTLDFEKVGLP